jgi:hypothetical protein
MMIPKNKKNLIEDPGPRKMSVLAPGFSTFLQLIDLAFSLPRKRAF